MRDTDVFESAVQDAYDGWTSELATELDALTLVRATHAGSAARLEWHRRRPEWLTRRHLMLVAAGLSAVLVAAIGMASISGLRPEVGGPQTSTPSPTSTAATPASPPPKQMSAINRLVDALNRGETDAFVEAFAADGSFNPRGDFAASSSMFGQTQPVRDVELVERWLSIVGAWRLEADVRGCASTAEPGWVGPSNPVVRCAVTTKWHTLELEVGESWTFEFAGERIVHWSFDLVDLDPVQRSLPLGYDGLESWERWLTQTDPESAARFLNPRRLPGDCDGCPRGQESLFPADPVRPARLARLLFGAENDWSIDGRRFWPLGFIPYDPAHAPEIGVSIDEFLREQGGGK